MKKTVQQTLNIIGKSPQIREILKKIEQIAPSDLPVLILGESGSGKEVIANAIHQLSPRRDRNLISVNCGAIPEGLIESELFGHEKGAFTGAIASKPGYFEIADKGSIFLDEVGDLPLQTQVKLLRVLETGQFMRVGGTSYLTVDVRVIAATNRDVEKMVEEGKFRRDLFYRLKGFIINLPPLRERREDIPLFVQHFTEEFIRRNGGEYAGFSDDAIQVLMEYPWPGNIRELKNTVESLLVLNKEELITARQVLDFLGPKKISDRESGTGYLPVVTNKTVDQAERELIYRALLSLGIEITDIKKLLTGLIRHLDQRFDQLETNTNLVDVEIEQEITSLEEMEKKMIKKALEKYHGNRKKIAEVLQISERTLYRKIKEYGLE